MKRGFLGTVFLMLAWGSVDSAQEVPEKVSAQEVQGGGGAADVLRLLRPGRPGDVHPGLTWSFKGIASFWPP